MYANFTMKTKRILQNFVVFEGGDASGTTTQLEKLRNFFDSVDRNTAEINQINQKNSSLPLLYDTFEPTDNSIGKLIRQGLKGEIPFNNKTIALLFAADRNEHIYGPGGILERCNRGELVVCDRFLFSSLVYQGITCGNDFPIMLNQDFPLPELLIFLDIDPKIAQERMLKRSQKEIYENLDFQIKVRERYLALMKEYDSICRIVIIDASKPVERVFDEVWSAIEKMPIFKEK